MTRTITVDLQTHSHFSDGDASPTELARRAAQAGLRVAALTDHATLAGVGEFAVAGRALDLRTVVGVEITCLHGERWFDTLAYGVDMSHPGLRTVLAANQEVFSTATQQYFDWLCARQAGPTPQTIRDHYGIAYDLLLGYWPNKYRREIHGCPPEQIKRDMRDAGYSYEGRADLYLKLLPTFAVALNAVHAAGGILTLAHPPQTGAKWFAAEPDSLVRVERLLSSADGLVEAGLDAVEWQHHSHTAATSAAVERWVTRHGSTLLKTGGSDYHGHLPGEHKPHVPFGRWGLTADEFAPIAERLGSK